MHIHIHIHTHCVNRPYTCNIVQILKKNDQMYAMLAVAVSLCPQAQGVDETIAATLRDKYGERMVRVYIYIYRYICVCVCVCLCIYMGVYIYSSLSLTRIIHTYIIYINIYIYVYKYKAISTNICLYSGLARRRRESTRRSSLRCAINTESAWCVYIVLNYTPLYLLYVYIYMYT